MTAHADRDEMHALRELAASAEGLKLDLQSACENLSLAALRIRTMETEMQRRTHELRDVTIHRDRLLAEKEQVWGSVVAREERPEQLGQLPRDPGSEVEC